MKFCDAMKILKSGGKVTRKPWKDGVFFMVVDNDVKSYQPKLTHYTYNEDIMVSDGWLVEGEEGQMKFCDIIPFLMDGNRAAMADWKHSYIFLDKQSRSLIVHSMEIFPFNIEFESFVAEDWIELKNDEEESVD